MSVNVDHYNRILSDRFNNQQRNRQQKSNQQRNNPQNKQYMGVTGTTTSNFYTNTVSNKKTVVEEIQEVKEPVKKVIYNHNIQDIKINGKRFPI